MPKFDVTAPDGQKFSVNGPEGSSVEDAYQYVRDNLWTPKHEAPKEAAKPEEAPTLGTTLLHGAERGILPAAGGMAGIGMGAAAGSALGPIGTVLGGLAGGFGGGALTSALQEKLLQSYPELDRKSTRLNSSH